MSFIKKFEKEMIRLAGEEVHVENIGGVAYVFGSELACLRINYKFPAHGFHKVDYSVNRKSWYYMDEGIYFGV